MKIKSVIFSFSITTIQSKFKTISIFLYMWFKHVTKNIKFKLNYI